MAVAIIFMIALAINLPGMMRAVAKKRTLNNTFARLSEALVSRNYAEAYSMCSPEFRNITSYQDFTKQQAMLESASGKLTSIKSGRSEVEGSGDPMQWLAVIQATMGYARQKITFEYQFRMRGETWELYGYRRIVGD